jgi:pilus assembly protein Flp/PilA
MFDDDPAAVRGASPPIRHFIRDRRAVTALEYGLIAALIAVVIIGSLSRVGTNISTSFSKVSSSIAATK